MPVATCGKCGAELDVDPADVGHRVECPACLATFTAGGGPVTRSPDAGTVVLSPDPSATVAASPAPRMAAPPPVDREGGDGGTRTVVCPACDGEASVLTADLGHRVECPLCDKTFTARDRKSRRRPRIRYDDEDGDGDDDGTPTPRAVVRRAERRLAGPGAALQVLGWLDVAAGVIGVILGLVFLADGTVSRGSGSWALVWLNLGPGLSGVLLGGLKAFGGAAMKGVRNRPLALLAAYAACVPLNVNFCLVWLLFPAYIVSIVYGILALTSLFRADVKRAFEVTRPGGDVDAV